MELNHLATAYAHFWDIQFNLHAEKMPWDWAPALADKKGVYRLCMHGHKSYGAAHCWVLLFVAGVDNHCELFCNTCLFSVELKTKSRMYHLVGSAYPCSTCVECSQLACCFSVFGVGKARTPM